MSDAASKTKLSAAALVLTIGLGTTMLVYRGEAGETPRTHTDIKGHQ